MVLWIERLFGRRKKQHPDDTLSGSLDFSCYLSGNPDRDVKRIKQALNTFLDRHPDRAFYGKPFIEILEPESIYVSVSLCAKSKEQWMLYAHNITNELKERNLSPPDACFLGGRFQKEVPERVPFILRVLFFSLRVFFFLLEMLSSHYQRSRWKQWRLASKVEKYNRKVRESYNEIMIKGYKCINCGQESKN